MPDHAPQWQGVLKKKGNVNVHCRHAVNKCPRQWPDSGRHHEVTLGWDLAMPLCYVLRQNTLLSQFPSPPKEWLGAYKLLGILDKILRG